MKKITLILLILSLSYSLEHYYEDGKEVYLKEVKPNYNTSQNKNTQVKYYTTKNGTVLGVRKNILVKCKENRDCEKELLKYDVEKIEEISKNYYLLHLRDRNKIFTLSREIYNETYIELSHPDFEMTHKAY